MSPLAPSVPVHPQDTAPTEMDLVRRVAVIAAALALPLGVYAGVTSGRVQGLSVLLGAVVGVGNLWALAWLLRRVISAGSDTDKLRTGVLLTVKMAGLYGFLWVLWSRAWVSAGWFMVGMSGCVLALLVSGAWPMSSPPSSPAPKDRENP